MPDHPILPTPSEMITHLDRFVQGQVRAKQDIAVAVYNHYLSQAFRNRAGTDLGRHHILMIGPTGVGKTHLVRTLADFLGVPVGFASATGLVEAGYKGSSVESIVATLLNRADGDPKQAEKGIIFLDEVDKIRRRDTGSRDVSGEGVQNALLTLLDGRRADGFEGARHAPIDTSRVLFICTGAFVGLQAIVENRLGTAQRKIGFHARPQEDLSSIPDQPIYEALCQAETRDLVEFGMIPEFVGRFATITVLHELSHTDLRGILDAGIENSALHRQQLLAKVHGIDLQIAPEALDALTEQAVALGTGARGLHRLIGRAIDPVDHRWPELADQGVTKVTITKECIENGAEPLLESNSSSLPRQDAALRAESLSNLPNRLVPVMPEQKPATSNGISDVSGWSDERIWNEVERLKKEHLDWEHTTGSALKWWTQFENENRHRPALLLRVAEELRNRDATITDFFLAYLYSNTDNIQANLHYLDYMRLKKKSTPGED